VHSLIAIESCERDVLLNQAQRETWANPGSPPCGNMDIRFFYGMPRETIAAVREFDVAPENDDCVYLPVPDDYLSLSIKTQAICRWAVERDYEFLHIVDSDTYVRPGLLWATADYTGMLARNSIQPYLWGAFYSLSRRAMELVADAKELPSPYEDVCIGTIMRNAGIEPTVDPSRFLLKKVGGHIDRNWDEIPADFSAVAELSAKEMRRFHHHVVNCTLSKMKSGPRRIGR
jgi:hypothetical protein